MLNCQNCICQNNLFAHLPKFCLSNFPTNMVIDKSVGKTICNCCMHCFESRVGSHVFMFLIQMKDHYKKSMYTVDYNTVVF